LEADGISAEVDLRTIRPLDKGDCSGNLAKLDSTRCRRREVGPCSVGSEIWRSAWKKASTIDAPVHITNEDVPCLGALILKKRGFGGC
jgi:pyruvate/2-oxoglutarate/acetoin dehydrogenase E1 component